MPVGDIEVELYTESAPKAAQNFLDLANKGFYDDVVFHRVIPGFVIQGGDGEHGKKASLNGGRVGTGWGSILRWTPSHTRTGTPDHRRPATGANS